MKNKIQKAYNVITGAATSSKTLDDKLNLVSFAKDLLIELDIDDDEFQIAIYKLEAYLDKAERMIEA